MINAMAADSKHGVWLGTDRGLAYYNERQTKWYSPTRDHPFIRSLPTDITFDTHGTPYVATGDTGSLYTLPNGENQWAQMKLDPVHRIISLTAAADGGIWVTHGRDLAKIGGMPIAPPPLPYNSCGLSHPSVDASGNVWIITFGCDQAPQDSSRVLQYNVNLKRWIHYQLYAPELDTIRALTIGADGTPYILGTHGVYSHTTILTGNLEAPLTDWLPITTINQSLSRAVTAPDGLIAADRKRGLWIASIVTGEVWHYTADHITSFGQHIQPDTLNSLHVDTADRLWLLGQNTLVMFDGRTWRNISAPDIGYVSRITSSPDGRIWLIGQRGIAVYDPTRDATP
jgi:ligand-binding sensor domain-containing protein